MRQIQRLLKINVSDFANFECKTVIGGLAIAGEYSKQLYMVSNPVKNKISYSVEVFYRKFSNRDNVIKSFDTLEDAVQAYNSY